MWPLESLNKLSDRGHFLFWWVVRDDGTIHLADKDSFMRTLARDYFPQLANTKWDKDIFLNHKDNYGVFINPLDVGGKQWSFWLGFSMRDISDIKKRIIILGLIASLSALLVLGVILAFTVKHFTRPIKDLIIGSALIGKGDLAHRVKITSQDELGQFAHSFNSMAEELEKTTVSKDYVDNIIASMIDALIVVDPEARISTVNKATCEILGYDEEELIGSPVEIIFADDVPLRGEKLERLIKQGKLINYETNFKTKDGKEIPVLFSASVTKDKEGNIVPITPKVYTQLKKEKNR